MILKLEINPALTHYLIISHLLVAKEKGKEVQSLMYTSEPFEFLHFLLCCKSDLMPKSDTKYYIRVRGKF